MNIPFLDLSRMEEGLKERLRIRFSEVLDSGIFSGGKEVQRFEDSVAQFSKSAFALSLLFNPYLKQEEVVEIAIKVREFFDQ